eukprot:TRINITY_DN2190_c0_g1_i2.p6 TRINITY_DN2190_c0_g1~~TRINITY_DN2190_c0_g1_i2.p6  ORF type:complete len:143 (-),score=57.16 TRINITY_DN2190_c0_g1_i2:1210-1638(-)
MYEQQKDQLAAQSFNMDQANFATQSLKETVVTVNTMKEGAKVMRQQMKQINVDNVEDMQDELEDLMQDNNDIQEALGRSYAVPDDLDEESLEAELEDLEATDLGELESAGPSYLDALPNVPEPAVITEAATTQKEAVPMGTH